jgi:peptidoglycan/LPS O-acetylase OafA/YrhL
MGNRVYGLDILRAIAILSVIYSHSFFLISDHVSEKVYNLLSFDGVTLFFVLSGFLIGGILIRTINQTEFTHRNLFHFWIRRWFRTLPNYFFMLLLLLTLTFSMKKPLPRNLADYFFFIQNFSTPHPSFFPEAWSLSVEEWFYLLIPAGLFLTHKIGKLDKKYLILTWSLAIITLVTGLRIYRSIRFGYQDFESWDLSQRKLVITRLDSIMFGFLAAWINHYFRKFWLMRKRQMLFLGILLLCFPPILEAMNGKNMFFNNYFLLTITSIGTFFVLPGLSELRQGRGILFRSLSFVSIISYSMYLVNFSLVQLIIIPSLTGAIVLVTKNHLLISIIRYSLYWVLTFILSFLLYKYWEKPLMQLREKFRPSPAISRATFR